MTNDKPESFEDFVLRAIKDAPSEPFKPNAFHNTDGDLLEVFWENVSYYAEWLNPKVTVLRAEDDKRIVGCQVWGLSKTMNVESSESSKGAK